MSNNKYKILIVEDDGSIRTFVTALLESNGFQVVTAGTASAGLLSFCPPASLRRGDCSRWHCPC